MNPLASLSSKNLHVFVLVKPAYSTKHLFEIGSLIHSGPKFSLQQVQKGEKMNFYLGVKSCPSQIWSSQTKKPLKDKYSYLNIESILQLLECVQASLVHQDM